MSDDIEHINESRALITASWDDVPHLDESRKRQLVASIEPHMRDARTKGVPNLGAGAIYPIQREHVEVPPFAIPEHYKRAYAMDVGWKVTAALWGAKDPSSGVLYAYAEYYRGQQVPAVHAQAIKARGDWVRGAIDPAAQGRSQHDGKRLKAEYEALDLKLQLAHNDVEAGLHRVWSLLETGMLKVFSTMPRFWREYHLYRREVKTNDIGVQRAIVVKKDDHLMDCLRYLVMTFDQIASVRPVASNVMQVTGPGDTLAGI